MADKSISEEAVEQLAVFGTEESGTLSPLLKTPHSNNITLSDWNELLHVSDRSLADVQRLYNVLSAAIPDLENYTKTEAKALANRLDSLEYEVGDRLEFKGTVETVETLLSLSNRRVGDVFTVVKEAADYLDNTTADRYSSWVYVGNGNGMHGGAWVCLSGFRDLSVYVKKESLGTNVGNIPTYQDVNTGADTANGTIPVATPEKDGHATNKKYVDDKVGELEKLDIYSFDIEQAKDKNGTNVFGVYDFKITLKDGTVFTKPLDLPLEAVQIASVNDIMRDGDRYLEITFVDPAVDSILVKFDDIFNLDDLVKAEVHVGPTPPDDDSTQLWVDTASMGAKNSPYDVEAILDDGNPGYVKLVIEGVQADTDSTHVFRLVSRYCEDDFVYRSGACVVTLCPDIPAACSVDVSNAASPTHFAVVGKKVYLYIPKSGGSDYSIFVKGLTEIVTGASIELVETLPEDAESVTCNSIPYNDSYKFVKQSEVDWRATASTIVKRSSSAGISANYGYSDMRSSQAATWVPNSEAVIKELDKTVNPVKERIDRLESAVYTYQEVESTAYAITVPKNASETAIINSISGRPLDTVDLMSTIGTGRTYDYSPDLSAHATWETTREYGASYSLRMTSYASGMESGADTGILEPGTYTAIAIIDASASDSETTRFQISPFDTVYTSDVSAEGLTMRTYTFTLAKPAPFYLRLQNNYSNDGPGGCDIYVYLRIYRVGPAAVSKVSSYDAAGVLVDSFEIPTAVRTLPAYGYADNKIDFDTKIYSQAYNTRSIINVTVNDEYADVGGSPSVPADKWILDGFARVIIENNDRDTYLGAYTTDIANYGDYYNIGSYVYVPKISDSEIKSILSNRVLVYRNYSEATVTTNISASLTAGPRELKVSPGGTIVFENPSYNPCGSVVTYLLVGGASE